VSPRSHDPVELLTDPHARLAVALVLSLLLWAPFGLAAVGGDLDPAAALVRWVVAFLGTRIAVHGIGHLLVSYHRDRADEVDEAAAAAAAAGLATVPRAVPAGDAPTELAS
jgi:peptidoglycan/LPS O-acetylase OafA/YrhL